MNSQNNEEHSVANHLSSARSMSILRAGFKVFNSAPACDILQEGLKTMNLSFHHCSMNRLKHTFPL